MIKLRKKCKELNLLVKRKEYKTVCDNTCTFLTQNKIATMGKGKKTSKNIVFYTF